MTTGGFEGIDPTAYDRVAYWQQYGWPEVFVSFRSSVPEDMWGARLVHQDLEARYGFGASFCSQFSIPPAAHAEDLMNAALAEAKLLALIVGRDWANSLPSREGNRGHPWVIHEVETALAQRKRILPIVITNRRRIEGNLPPSIARVAGYQTMRIPLANDVIDERHPQVDPSDIDTIFMHTRTVTDYIAAVLCPQIIWRSVHEPGWEGRHSLSAAKQPGEWSDLL